MLFHNLSVCKQRHMPKRKTGLVNYYKQNILRKEIRLQKQDQKKGTFYLQLMPPTTERAISFVTSSYTCFVELSPENTLSIPRNRQEHQRWQTCKVMYFSKRIMIILRKYLTIEKRHTNLKRNYILFVNSTT